MFIANTPKLNTVTPHRASLRSGAEAREFKQKWMNKIAETTILMHAMPEGQEKETLKKALQDYTNAVDQFVEQLRLKDQTIKADKQQYETLRRSATPQKVKAVEESVKTHLADSRKLRDSYVKKAGEFKFDSSLKLGTPEYVYHIHDHLIHDSQIFKFFQNNESTYYDIMKRFFSVVKPNSSLPTKDTFIASAYTGSTSSNKSKAPSSVPNASKPRPPAETVAKVEEKNSLKKWGLPVLAFLGLGGVVLWLLNRNKNKLTTPVKHPKQSVPLDETG
jgi:hypothetical protein